MRKRLIIILAIIVLLPLAVLVWLGVTLAQREQERAMMRYHRVLDGHLDDICNNMSRLIHKHERELLRALDVANLNVETLRSVVRQERLVRQLFVARSNGSLLYPEKNSELSGEERAFLQRTKSLRENGEPFWRPPEVRSGQVLAEKPVDKSRGWSGKRVRTQPVLSGASFGWQTWFWGDGLQLIFWQHRDDGLVIGAEVERVALVADIIGSLPASGYRDPLPDGRIMLEDASGKIVYQWGAFQPSEKSQPAVEKAAPAPFSAWSFRYYISPNLAPQFERSLMFNMGVGLSGLVLVLLALAFYFYRESSRDIHEALQRVTFVNQVSHELKTPLTNIRMYAELLEKNIGDDEPRLHQYIETVVAETGRLSRLINNVLTFAKERRKKLRLHPRVAVIDDVIQSVVSSFTPALEALGIKVVIEGSAPGRVEVDVDMVEQILGNLVNNVEKYATGATRLTIEVCQKKDKAQTRIVVRDNGKGIPQTEHENIFKPFVRLSNKLTDGVSGTGIGLSIARRLARLHGGNLVLLPSHGDGAAFEITLHTPCTG